MPPTREARLLDVVITPSEYPMSINVELPTLRSLIHRGQFESAVQPRSADNCRPSSSIAEIRLGQFCDDLRSLKLLIEPLSDADGSFECYNTMMCRNIVRCS